MEEFNQEVDEVTKEQLIQWRADKNIWSNLFVTGSISIVMRKINLSRHELANLSSAIVNSGDDISPNAKTPKERVDREREPNFFTDKSLKHK